MRQRLVRHLPIPWMLWFPVGLHLVWAYSLLAEERTITLSLLAGLQHLHDLGLSPQALAVLLVTASFLSVFALFFEPRIGRRRAFLLLLPQYALMLIAFFSDAWTLHTSIRSTTTGMLVSRDLLLPFLGAVMCAAILHTFSILERFVLRWK